ncbi:MAG: hypothetical protein ACOC5R_00095 [Elusimicrobiota bacterium]
MSKRKKSIQISLLVNTRSPYAVLEEVKCNFIHKYPFEEFIRIRDIFESFMDLFDGRFPGYKHCTTPYHDILHATDTVLAFSRLVDGYNIKKKALPIEKVKAGIIASLFHDSGYIQDEDDGNGTGAKFTKNHIQRSIIIAKKIVEKFNLDKKMFDTVKSMIMCTDLKTHPEEINFRNSGEEKILGMMVGTADIIGQMASRIYLEKLLYLFQEFKEAEINTYKSEDELVENTADFFKNTIIDKLKNDFENIYKYSRIHFKRRYNINSGLYMDAIKRQINYLEKILEESPNNYRDRLRRKIPIIQGKSEQRERLEE